MSQSNDLTEQEYENFRDYHNLQYDRIDKLESRREIFNSIVLTASLGIITFGFSKDSFINIWIASGLASIIILANCMAIIFTSRSFEFIKMHQDRAKAARAIYAPELNAINDLITKRDHRKDMFGRTKLYKGLHILTIFVITMVYSMSIYSLIKTDQGSANRIINKSTSSKPVSTTTISLTTVK